MSEDLDSNKIKLSSIVSAFRNLATSESNKVDEICNTDITFALIKVGDDIENLIEQLNKKDQTFCTESLHQSFTQLKVLSQNLDVKVDCKKLIFDTEVSFISNGLKEFLRVKNVQLDGELSDVFKEFVLKYIEVYNEIYGHFSRELSSESNVEAFFTTTLNYLKSSLSIIVQNIHSTILDCYQMLESEDWVKYKNTDIFLQIQRRKKYIFHVYNFACNKKEQKKCDNKPKGSVENSDQTKYFFSDISSSENSCETLSSESESSSESSWQTISSYKTLESHNTSSQGLRNNSSVSSTSVDDSENTTSNTSTSSSDSTHFNTLADNLNPKVVETIVNQDNKTEEYGKENGFISENDKNNENELYSSTNDLKTHKTQPDALYSEISSISSISTVECSIEKSSCVEIEQDISSSNTKLTELALVKPLKTPMIGAGVKSEDILSKTNTVSTISSKTLSTTPSICELWSQAHGMGRQHSIIPYVLSCHTPTRFDEENNPYVAAVRSCEMSWNCFNQSQTKVAQLQSKLCRESVWSPNLTAGYSDYDRKEYFVNENLSRFKTNIYSDDDVFCTHNTFNKKISKTDNNSYLQLHPENFCEEIINTHNEGNVAHEITYENKPFSSNEKISDVELASSATSVDCEQDCCPLSQLAEIGFPCFFWNPLFMEQMKKRKGICNCIQVIKSGEEPEGFQHIDPDFKGTTVIFKLCEDINEKKDYKEEYQDALQETRKSKQQLIDALESSISKETERPSIEVKNKKQKYKESLEKLNGASKKYKSTIKEHSQFETPSEIESRYKLANEGQKNNMPEDILTNEELRTFNLLLKMIERVRIVKKNLPLKEFRKIKNVIAEEENKRKPSDDKKLMEKSSQKVDSFDDLNIDDNENYVKKTKKIKKCCKFFSNFCSKKFLTLNDRPGATVQELTRDFIEKQWRKNTEMLVNKEEPKKQKKDKEILKTKSLTSEESIASCRFPGCYGQKDFRQVLGYNQFKKLYSVLSLINLKNINKLLPENLYNVVQDCNISVEVDFNRVTAELLVENWKNQLKERKIELDEVLYSIFYPIHYVDCCEQNDFIKLQKEIKSWLSNIKKEGEDFPVKNSISKSKKYIKDAAFIDVIVNRGDFVKTYTSTVRRFKNNPEFRDFQDSPYAPHNLENEMKKVVKEISVFERARVLKQKYIHKKSQELKKIQQLTVKSHRHPNPDLLAILRTKKNEPLIERSSTAPSIRAGCVDLGQTYKTEPKISNKRIQHKSKTENRFNSTTNSPIACSIISRNRSGSSVISSRNDAYKQNLYNPTQIIRRARQEAQPFRTELKRPTRPRKLKSLPHSASIKSESLKFSGYNDKIPRSFQVSNEDFFKVKLTCGTEYMRRRSLKLKPLTNKKVTFDMVVE